MKKVLAILIFSSLILSCNSSNQKEKELMKKENELLKRELEVQKKENTLIEKSVKIDEVIPDNIKIQYANFSSSIQRKIDISSNLIEIIKSTTSNENEVLNNLIDERNSFSKFLIVNDIFNNESMFTFETKENRFNVILERVLELSNKYPKIKNDQSFLEISSHLEGTNNRISIEKMRYNKLVKQRINGKKYPLFNLDK